MMSEMLIQPPPLYLADVVRLNGPGYDYYEACVTHSVPLSLSLSASECRGEELGAQA